MVFRKHILIPSYIFTASILDTLLCIKQDRNLPVMGRYMSTENWFNNSCFFAWKHVKSCMTLLQQEKSRLSNTPIKKRFIISCKWVLVKVQEVGEFFAYVNNFFHLLTRFQSLLPQWARSRGISPRECTSIFCIFYIWDLIPVFIDVAAKTRIIELLRTRFCRIWRIEQKISRPASKNHNFAVMGRILVVMLDF